MHNIQAALWEYVKRDLVHFLELTISLWSIPQSLFSHHWLGLEGLGKARPPVFCLLTAFPEAEEEEVLLLGFVQ